MAAKGRPEDAAAMSAYMRGLFPFFGVKTPQRRALVKAGGKIASWPELQTTVLQLYSKPQREAHYAALDLLEANFRTWTAEVVPLMENLVLTHSWWDTVDRLASPLMGRALQKFPQHQDRPERWIAEDSFWLQRLALLYQLKARESTDRERLARYITATMASPELFLRKAIGWALRQYGYTNPEWVREFVQEHRESLSALSLREATRALPKSPA